MVIRGRGPAPRPRGVNMPFTRYVVYSGPQPIRVRLFWGPKAQKGPQEGLPRPIRPLRPKEGGPAEQASLGALSTACGIETRVCLLEEARRQSQAPQPARRAGSAGALSLGLSKRPICR